MSRYDSYGGLDSYAITDGDTFFQGMDLKHDRSNLQAGMLALSVNKRLFTGRAETRLGSSYPASFNPPFSANIWPCGGTCVFSDPNANEWVVVAMQSASRPVRACQDSAVGPGKDLSIPSTHNLSTGPVWMVQAFDKLLLLQSGVVPLMWDGIAAGFVEITKSNPGDISTQLIPNVGYGISFQNRMLYVNPNMPDEIIMSDVLDYTSYDPVLAVFRINSGEHDQICAIAPYNNQSVVVFMAHSIHLLSNFTIDPTQAIQEVITTQFGLLPAIGAYRGRKAWCQVGGDIMFLSDNGGIYRVSQAWESRVMSQPVPVSDPIQPLIDGIDWNPDNVVGWTNVIAHGIYVYWTLGLKNWQPYTAAWVILVYNTSTGQFESIECVPTLDYAFTDLFVTNYGNLRRLFVVEGQNGANNPMIRLLDDGQTDYNIAGTMVPVQDVIETRGYGWGSASGPGSLYGIQRQSGPGSSKRFDRLSLTIRTQNPSASVYASSAGWKQDKLLRPTPIIKSNTKFYTWAHKTFNPATDDPTEPYRQDYTGTTDTDTGLLNPKTESLERMTIRTVGRWCSIKVINTQGSCDVVEVSVDARETKRNVRIAA